MTDDLLKNFRSSSPTTRSSPFGYTGDDPSQLFEDLGRGINPAGFVSNLDNAPASVIINESGITVIDGAIVVSNPGATVIIDGTSNMFKIVASGTMTHTQGALSSGSSTVEITGSGLPAQSPSFAAFLTEGTSPSDTANRDEGRFTKPRAATNQLWAASSSGGSPTSDFFPLTWQAYAHSAVSGGNPAIRLAIDNGQGASVSAYMRYYIFLETAI